VKSCQNSSEAFGFHFFCLSKSENFVKKFGTNSDLCQFLAIQIECLLAYDKWALTDFVARNAIFGL